MEQNVTIKGVKSGIVLKLSEGPSFDELLPQISEKFESAASFFGTSRIVLKAEGRNLSEEETGKILDIRKENGKEFVWAYIPHFFNSPYYVYQYATSFSASLAIYEKVKNNEPKAFENYKEMLKSGGSDYPIEIVKKAGVDFTKMDAINGVVTRYAELLEELEKALNE